ncbi:phage tail protein [Yersinia mollaretii]|uniref:Phage tail protein n=1 Tax=Yersinia mollaretii TaxID=33060 RepID=A0AA44CIY1_YERMO|nr:phage tail protein [Yersinia mollaretii]NIL21486.1 phage tail protein [Yersinia mollaretii]CNJ31085.1 putative tail fiber assembly protein [Yersinia mollaretii]CQR16180.1 putative tail fiber assembly protein [Yersinia mollaretii]
MKIFFSPTMLSFRTLNMVEDGSYGDGYGDFIELSDSENLIYWKQSPPAGQVLGVVNGRPAWVDIPPPEPLTADELNATARQYRDNFIVATDPMMVSDYSIDDIPLTEAQRTELTTARAIYRVWPTVENWPLIELPELPQWLLVEAVNQGYRVPVWPPLPA